jgi:hemoglobin-like flavoprotein
MNQNTVKLVQDSWAKVLPIAPQAARLFYHNLFTLDPTLKPLFRGDMEEQGRKLMRMIDVAVGKLDQIDSLVPVLQQLGRRHADYGVEPEHYRTVGSALLATLAQGLGEDFTDPVRAAWAGVYGVMAEVMTDAAYSYA